MANYVDDARNLQESIGPALHAFVITPSDTVNLTHATRAIYVGGAGDISLDMRGGETAVLHVGVVAGTVLSVQAIRVRATGTTATNLVAWW